MLVSGQNIDKRLKISMTKNLKIKGYEVSINMANCESLTNNDINDIKDMYKSLSNDIKCIYLADTFGNCRPKQITKYKINDDFSIRYEIQNIKDSKVANSADIATNELGISFSF